MSVSTINTGLYEPLTSLINSILLAACAAYLVKHYFEKREKLTWLFITFFAVISVCFFVDFLIVTDIIYFDVQTTIGYTFLIGSAIIALIGLAMLKINQLYTLPLFVVVLAFFHRTLLQSNYTQTVNLTQAFSYVSTGQFIGNPWYIALKIIFPNFAPLGQLNTIILNLQLDPLSIIIPNNALYILGPYDVAIAVPTIVLFYYLAWANRSGRSLGFALGLTTSLILGLMVNIRLIGGRSVEATVLYIIVTIFFASGIFGVFDRLMKREESPKQQIEKEKT